MNALIAVVVAFLANGDMNYAAVDARDQADCEQKVVKIAHDRLDQNKQEEGKVLGFAFECVAFENKLGVTVPSQPDSAKPKHIPGDREASSVSHSVIHHKPVHLDLESNHAQ